MSNKHGFVLRAPLTSLVGVVRESPNAVLSVCAPNKHILGNLFGTDGEGKVIAGG